MSFTGKFLFLVCMVGLWSCRGDHNHPAPSDDNGNQTSVSSFDFTSLKVDGRYDGFTYYNVKRTPEVQISFEAPLQESSVSESFSFRTKAGSTVSFSSVFSRHDSTVTIKPKTTLAPITAYVLQVSEQLKSKKGGNLNSNLKIQLITAIDSTDKFPRISDSALLTLVQKQTFKYFWDFGHPASGMARERNTSGNTVTTGGTGFGIMAILVGIHRDFITRSQGLNRITKIVDFLRNKCTRYHGAFAHWINGETGETIPFSQKDDGADLVETSFLMEGLLTARQFFDKNTPAEDSLRTHINDLWDGLEWTWFQQNGQQVLYWHWSPDYDWTMNLPIKGWNECLITYVLAASSNTDPISKEVYDKGWAHNGSMKNGNSYFGVTLPLGPYLAGPLFFSHYSFLGLNPHDLSDAYANYWTQNTAQTEINYLYCVNNPNDFNGYSEQCWGLTASDDNSGYDAHSPANDDGVITPSAAISSMPYTPDKSMAALKFFYYKLGDKIWGKYGFKDAFNLTDVWFADSYLAIDQGPQICMIENYRSGLLWDLFMSCPEIKNGLKRLGFKRY